MNRLEELSKQLTSDIEHARHGSSVGVSVSKSIIEKNVTTDFGMMKVDGFEDVAVVVKGDGEGDALWLVRGSVESPKFQVCFGYGDDFGKAQREASANSPELGDITAVVPFSKGMTRNILGFNGNVSFHTALSHFLSLYNKSRERSAYEPKILEPEKTHFCKALEKVEADEFGELRLVTGIVLEPDIVDSQKDTYTADEIRKTAHLYMLDFQNIGLQHKAMINTEARPVESFIVPENTQGGVEIGGVLVKSGTWVMTVKVFDDDIWSGIKRGELTGFSIGGFARRVPLSEGPSDHNPNAIT